MALFIPMRVNELHIAIKAAELRQELGLVQIALPILNIRLNTRLLVESLVSVILSIINSLAKQVIVLNPRKILLLSQVFLLLGEGDDVNHTSVEALIFLSGEEVNFDVH